MASLKIKLPPILADLPFYTDRYIIIYGGRDSSKSHSVARTLIIKAYTEKCNILCTREIQNSIKDSVYSLLSNVIEEYGLSKAFEIVKDEIRCVTTGSKFIFKGLRHNVTDVKGKEGINYCWVEEGENISSTSLDVLIPTIRKENSQLYITFNPNMIDDPVYDRFITHLRPDSRVIKINYNDNPFLSETSKKEIQYCKENDIEKYKWVYLGECRTTTEARILHNIVIHNFDIDTSRQPHFGLDLGFNDPNALTQSYIYDNELYICREYYSNQLDPEELKSKLSNLEWITGKHIICDSSQPAMIKMFNSIGKFTVAGSRKSIGQPQKEGAYKYAMAMYFKQFKKIHIHETNCPNACREFPRWSFQVDKNENIHDIVQDGSDHTLDSTIYALERQASIWYRSNFKR